MATDIRDLILRTVASSYFTTKDDTLTYEELDGDIKTIGDYLVESEAAMDVEAYDGGTTYSDGDTVLYSGQYWIYINATSGSGIAPGTNPLFWELESPGSTWHKKNQDSQLVGTSGTVTANEIIAALGLSFDLDLDGTTGNGEVGYVDLNTPPDGTVVDFVTWLAIDADLTPDTDTPQLSIVLYDGVNPDVTLSGPISAAELNAALKIGSDAVPSKVASQSLKLKIEGGNTSGTLKIKVNYV